MIFILALQQWVLVNIVDQNARNSAIPRTPFYLTHVFLRYGLLLYTVPNNYLYMKCVRLLLVQLFQNMFESFQKSYIRIQKVFWKFIHQDWLCIKIVCESQTAKVLVNFFHTLGLSCKFRNRWLTIHTLSKPLAERIIQLCLINSQNFSNFVWSFQTSEKWRAL